MITAPVADQRRLLDIQELDTRLAQLAHQRRSHPTLASLEELTVRADDLERAHTQARAALSDARRELLRAETDVEQVRNRAARGEEKLNSGQASVKELQNITSELEALARRKDVLEEAQLEQMELVEQAESDLAAIESQLEAIRVQITEVSSQRDAAFAAIDGEVETVGASRDRLREGVPENLMALYDTVRSQTGGLAVVALRGETTVGLQVPLSLTELAAIKAAPAEQVIQSEEYDYILVRVQE